MATGGLSRWFRENWVDLSRPKKGGGFEPCGRPDASEGKYPKCVPASRAAQMSPEAIRSAVARKRRAESTQTREGKKPIMVPTVKKASKNIPSDMDLYNRVKAEARAKFDVYPSAYANGWLVQEYKRRGGKYKTISKHETHNQSSHGNRVGGVGSVSFSSRTTPAKPKKAKKPTKSTDTKPMSVKDKKKQLKNQIKRGQRKDKDYGRFLGRVTVEGVRE